MMCVLVLFVVLNITIAGSLEKFDENDFVFFQNKESRNFIIFVKQNTHYHGRNIR